MKIRTLMLSCALLAGRDNSEEATTGPYKALDEITNPHQEDSAP